MNKQTSQLIINSFEVITRNNFKLTYSLSQHVLISLETRQDDNDIKQLYDFYLPLHNMYYDNYMLFVGRDSDIASSTVMKRQVIEELTDNLNEWDLDILNFIKNRKSPFYKELMFGGHTSFLVGSYANKMLRVQVLGKSLQNHEELAQTKTKVDAFLDKMVKASTAKTNANLDTKTITNNSESARIKVCNGMQYVLGGLYQKYYEDISPVAGFFDLNKMKQHRQKHFMGSHLHPKAAKKIMKRTLNQQHYILLNNTGNTVLRFYITGYAKGTAMENFIELPPLTRQKIAATTLGNFTTHKYFMVYNASESGLGSWEVEVMKG